jgi:hypothetical protein
LECHVSQSIDLLHQLKFATLFFGNDFGASRASSRLLTFQREQPRFLKK